MPPNYNCLTINLSLTHSTIIAIDKLRFPVCCKTTTQSIITCHAYLLTRRTKIILLKKKTEFRHSSIPFNVRTRQKCAARISHHSWDKHKHTQAYSPILRFTHKFLAMGPKIIPVKSYRKSKKEKKKKIKILRVRLPQEIVRSLNSLHLELKRTWITSIRTINCNIRSYRAVSLKDPARPNNYPSYS
ncbi:hypothetical protein CAJAP_01172 [Camponotus japonicus]